MGEFLGGPPRIAPTWDDLSPNQGGTVVVTQDLTSWTVTFEAVPQFLRGDSNNFSVTLNASGSVSMAYGATGGPDAIVGVTEGAGALDPGETDLSAAAGLSASGTTYERFLFGEWDLDALILAFLPSSLPPSSHIQRAADGMTLPAGGGDLLGPGAGRGAPRPLEVVASPAV